MMKPRSNNFFLTDGQLREKNKEKRKEMREKEIESSNTRPEMIHGERDTHKGIKEHPQPRARILWSKTLCYCHKFMALQRRGMFSQTFPSRGQSVKVWRP